MLFKRRNPKPLLRGLVEFFWPNGGWRRAATYVLHRMRRLPDTPERISIGIAAGLYVSFLPIWGLHFLSSALVAWAFRGNILAALLGTFYGNPLTFAPMAAAALETGYWLFGGETRLSIPVAVQSIGTAAGELGHNLLTPFTGEAAHWDRIASVAHEVYLPYFVGGLIAGIPFALATYYAHVPLIRAYQTLRRKKLAQRFETARLRQRAQEGGPEGAADRGPDTGETP